MTIYRGFDITRNEDGTFSIHSFGSHPVIAETFSSEDAAMSYIDQLKRGQRK